MSFVKVQGLVDAVKPEALPEGQYEAVISRMTYEDSGKQSSPRLQVILEVPTVANSMSVFYTLWIPKPEDTPKQANESRWKITEFCTAFGVNMEGDSVDIDSAQGHSASVLLGLRETEDGLRNTVRKVLLP
ncbi:MAG: DUF669 domain-containing protein [Geobacter sp.]|nr:MAG: DUF669 domain-containing protein [Geobacter sp.]